MIWLVTQHGVDDCSYSATSFDHAPTQREIEEEFGGLVTAWGIGPEIIEASTEQEAIAIAIAYEENRGV